MVVVPDISPPRLIIFVAVFPTPFSAYCNFFAEAWKREGQHQGTAPPVHHFDPSRRSVPGGEIGDVGWGHQQERNVDLLIHRLWPAPARQCADPWPWPQPAPPPDQSRRTACPADRCETRPRCSPDRPTDQATPATPAAARSCDSRQTATYPAILLIPDRLVCVMELIFHFFRIPTDKFQQENPHQNPPSGGPDQHPRFRLGAIARSRMLCANGLVRPPDPAGETRFAVTNRPRDIFN